MRNIIRVTAIVIITALICLPGFPVAAAGTAIVSVSAPAQPVSPSTQFTVSITVEPNNAIAGIQFNLSFSPSLVTVNSVSEGNLLKQNGASTYFMPGTINNTAGTVTDVAGAITTPGQTVSTSGTFAIITFTTGTTRGTSTLTLSNVIVGDINGQPVSVNMVNGQVSIDTPPVLTAIGNKTVSEGASLSFTISATDADGDTLTYSASSLPTGASFNASTHTFSWTPTYSQAGSYPNVHFQVSDGSLTDSEDITITVNDIDQLSVDTDAASNITTNGATLNGNLTSKGSASNINVSFEYGLTTSYGSTVAGVPATLTAPGIFTASIIGLTPNTLYHYRANAVGGSTANGSDQAFTTGNPAPVVVTTTASNITTSGATLNGNLTSKGSASSITVSFEYGLTTGYGSTVVGVPATLTAPGMFTADITGLTSNTLYHYRAKAVGDSTAYGSDQTFSSGNPAPVTGNTPPVVATDITSSITTSGATLNGNLTNKGSASTVAVSFEYGLTTSYGSTVAGIPAILTAPGTFTAEVTGLTPNTLYHYRAKAIGNGTAYGSDQTFTTSNTLPIVNTDAASNITTSGATLNGNLNSKGSASSINVSFEYGLTTSYGSTVDGIPATLTAIGTFAVDITGLSSNTLYHYRAKAVGDGTAYGSDRTFTTSTTQPVVTTDTASDITSNGAILHGNLSDKGSASIVNVSFEYGLTTNYGSTVAGVPITLTDPGNFIASINGLQPNTLYHFRAKAVGDFTAYGSDHTFTTNTTQPVVTTNTTSVTATSKPEITLLGVILNYNNEISKMGEPTSAKITFWISNPTFSSEIKPALVIKLDGEPLEVVTDLNLVEPESEGTIGDCIYIPSEGWKPGIYDFCLELVGPTGKISESEEQSLNVKPLATLINWSILLVVIAIAIGLGIIVTCVLLIRKRFFCYR